MGKITYENDPKFIAAEAEIVRICSTNWVQKIAYENLIKTEKAEWSHYTVYRLHVRPAFEPWKFRPILTTTTITTTTIITAVAAALLLYISTLAAAAAVTVSTRHSTTVLDEPSFSSSVYFLHLSFIYVSKGQFFMFISVFVNSGRWRCK